MKNRIGLTASLLALGSTCAMTTGCASTGKDSASVAGKNFDVCRDIDNSEKGRANPHDLKLSVNLLLAVERAEDCRQWYYDVSGFVTAADTTQAGIASGGGLGLLAGGAAASTNVFLATLVVGPEVFREVTRQEPQGVLAYQAAQATTLAECQLVRVREGLHDLVEDRGVLKAAIRHAHKQRETLTASIETFANKLLSQRAAQAAAAQATQGAAAIPAAALPFGQLVAQDPELKELVGLARRYDELIAAGENLQNEVDLLTGYSELDAEASVQAARDRIDERLALDLNTKVDSINLIWSNNFRQLTPTPEASLRSVLAAPFSFTAKLIAGEESKPGDPVEVARATYDFSASYGAHGVRALAIPTVVVAVDKAVLHPANWSSVDSSLDGMRSLSSAMSRTHAMLNGVASVDSDAAGGSCRLTPSSGVQTRSPQAPVPSQPADAPILVMAKG